MNRVPVKRVAVIATAYFRYSHADVILTRWFEKRAGDAAWGWDGPRSQIVAAYLAQTPPNDIGVATLGDNGVPLYGSVREALRCGGDTLAVDAVLLIAEHGDYPYNRFGQKLYPRYELFRKIVEVFDEAGRSVPVFNDKHLSWDFDLAKGMLETAKSRGFPLFASSSLPFCHHRPPLEVEGDTVEELVAVFPNIGGQPDHYGYHILEVVQNCIERRKGFEIGVARVTAFLGEAVWAAQDRGGWSQALFEAALEVAAPDELAVYRREDARAFPTHAFRLEYEDGLAVTLVGLHPLRTFSFALRRTGGPEAEATRCLEGDEGSYYAHFATLARVVEDFFWEHSEPFPPERALLTAGTLQAMIQAQLLPGVALPTPHLNIAYRPVETPAGLDAWSR